MLASLNSLVTIFLLIGLGYWLKGLSGFSPSFSGQVSSLITRLALPISIFVSVETFLTRDKLLSMASSLVFPLLALGLVYLQAFVFIKLFKLPVGRRGILINTFTNANTVFMGLPLNLALFGAQAMPYFLVYYLANTLSTFTLGTYVIARDSDQGQLQAAFSLKQFFSPPILAFFLGIAWLLLGLPIPEVFMASLQPISNLVTPLSLMYIGMNVKDVGLSAVGLDRDTWLALLGRFVLAPLTMVLVLKGAMLLGLSLEIGLIQTFVFQSAVPTLVIMPILARQAGGDVPYATNVVMTTTLGFLLVEPLVTLLLPLIMG